MRPSNPAVELSWLALGGFLLSIFAFVCATTVLVLSIIAPTPILLLLTFLFGPIAAMGVGLGWVGRRRARKHGCRGRALGALAIAGGGATLLVVLPLAATMGVPGFRKYQLEVREQQAYDFLSQIRMGAISHRYQSGARVFPAGDSGWVPTEPPTAQRYPYAAALWTEEPWASLDFRPSAAHFHQYRYRSLDDGRGFEASARGDIDGDGRMATYTLMVRVKRDGRIEEDQKPVRVPDDTR